jgi:pyrroline-5-carboxylate reductase
MPEKIALGFIGGGNMAEALIQGLLTSRTVTPGECWVCDILEERLIHLKKKFGIKAIMEASQLLVSSKAIILAVKPQNVAKALQALAPHWSQDRLLISIAAGIPMSYLAQFFSKTPRLIRVMPNTPALVLAGMSALAKNSAAKEEDLELAEKLFKAVGETVRVDEGQMDAVTGLSGSGPAYVFTFLEGLADAGVKMGLPRALALKLALQTVWGSAQMARSLDIRLGQLKEMVTSPGGTTIAGLHTLEKAGLRGILMDAVEAATQRSRELRELLVKENPSSRKIRKDNKSTKKV